MACISLYLQEWGHDLADVRGSEDNCWRQISPSTMWVLGNKLRSSDFMANAFPH